MKFTINDFEGPLDLLLHLIKTNKMDIYNINLEIITKEYLNFINSASDLSIDAYSEYLVMASELIYLKSKMLLKKDEDLEEEYSIFSDEELQRRLLEYQKIKNAAEDFRNLESKRNEIYTKPPSDFSQYRNDKQIINGNVSLQDLLDAFQNHLNQKRLEQPSKITVVNKELNLKERSDTIRNILRKNGKLRFLDLFDDISKPYVIITFLSILNMSNNNEIVIIQENNFSDIYIEVSEK